VSGLDEFRERARRWLAGNLEPRDPEAPAAPRHDEEYTAEFLASQRALQRKLFDGGYAGITWPAEYGGRGLTPEHELVFREEAAGYRLPDFGKSALTTFGVCAPTMLATASDEFKRRHIPRILAGEELWAQFFSEPGAGSDLAAVQTTAVRDGDDWLLNGQKTWSSYPDRCDFGLCLARTDATLPKHEGLTWFAVPTDAPGLTIRPFRMIDGTVAFCEEFFDDVRVPDSERVGEVNGGWDVTRRMLLFERDSDDIGSRSQLEPGTLAPDLVRLARAAGKGDDPAALDLIATAHVNDYVVRHLHVRIGDVLAGDDSGIGTAAFGKLARGTFDPVRARIAMELAGAAGTAWAEGEAGAEAALAYLNGRVYSIAGGTNEMQRNAIAERVHGLPRPRT
jgi:alkylation response protein AidB-like acyl-CoA dehydrogenase